MGGDQRVYSDEEFAIILRNAAELANRSEQPALPSHGLTLAEMKSAAAQAGYDPVLVEHAARMLALKENASAFERLVGGPLRHEQTATFPIALDRQRAARVLAAVRINATHYHSSDSGTASELGVMWRASGEGDVLSVVASPDEDSTTVSVAVDRRGTFFLTGTVASFVTIMSVLAGMGFYNEFPQFAPFIPVIGAGGAFAVARSFWSASTRKVRERVGTMMDSVGRSLAERNRQEAGSDIIDQDHK